LIEACSYPNSDFRIFGKPKSRPFRRMGVALTYGTEDVIDLVEKAKIIAQKIKVK
jgi:phosphoribosylglycinamide formyltransferase 2